MENFNWDFKESIKDKMMKFAYKENKYFNNLCFREFLDFEINYFT